MTKNNSKIQIKNEFKKFIESISKLDKKVIFILVSIAVLTTISYYITSRRFFRFNLYYYFVGNENIYFIEYAYWLTSEFISQFLLPCLFIIFFLKEKPKNYGVQLSEKKLGLSISAIFIIIMLPIIWIVSGFESFKDTYPQCQFVRENWNLFIIYEFCFLLYMTGWEFIWRGYMLFGLEKKFGNYAIFLQMIPFTILHNGKPQIETYSAIIAGILLGYLAIRTRSFFYGVIIHTSVMFSIDLISTLRYRTQIYGVGISDLFDLLKSIKF